MTSGTAVARRPPNRIAEIGTPAGSSHSGAIDGHCAASTVNRELGCAAGLPDAGVQSRPCQSVRCAGGSSVRPSHHTSPSSVSATLVKTVLLVSISRAFGLVTALVPGATPKKPASGLIAYSRPSAPNRIQAMSSPTVSTVQPGMRGLQHGQVGLAARGREGRRQVPGLALRRGDLEDEHVLGQPALVAGHGRGDPQRVALLAQQRVPAVPGPVRPDLPGLGEVRDVLGRRCRATARRPGRAPAGRPPSGRPGRRTRRCPVPPGPARPSGS